MLQQQNKQRHASNKCQHKEPTTSYCTSQRWQERAHSTKQGTKGQVGGALLSSSSLSFSKPSPASWGVAEALLVDHLGEQVGLHELGRVVLGLELQQLIKLGVLGTSLALGVGEGAVKVLAPAASRQTTQAMLLECTPCMPNLARKHVISHMGAGCSRHSYNRSICCVLSLYELVKRVQIGEWRSPVGTAVVPDTHQHVHNHAHASASIMNTPWNKVSVGTLAKSSQVVCTPVVWCARALQSQVWC